MVSAVTRRDARERALELLYEAESKNVDVAEVVADLPLAQDPYAEELALGVADHRIEIDGVLAAYARGWDVRRMAVMDRSVMRLGVFELATQLDIPTGAVLSEAVDLAGQYGSTDDTSKFVNGVLAAAAEEIRDGDGPWIPIDAVVFNLDGFTAIDDEMVALIDRLNEADVKVAMFSNGTGIPEHLAVVANPWPSDHAAASVAAFEAATAVVATEANRILLLDARTDNVAGAVEAGWHAVEYRGMGRLHRVLARLGIDGASPSA